LAAPALGHGAEADPRPQQLEPPHERDMAHGEPHDAAVAGSPASGVGPRLPLIPTSQRHPAQSSARIEQSLRRAPSSTVAASGTRLSLERGSSRAYDARLRAR